MFSSLGAVHLLIIININNHEASQLLETWSIHKRISTMQRGDGVVHYLDRSSVSTRTVYLISEPFKILLNSWDCTTSCTIQKCTSPPCVVQPCSMFLFWRSKQPWPYSLCGRSPKWRSWLGSPDMETRHKKWKRVSILIKCKYLIVYRFVVYTSTVVLFW